MPGFMNALLHSRKFWIAVVALVAVILLHYVPNFPPDVLTALKDLAMVLIGAIAVEDAAKHLSVKP